jgi:mevalonate kinase
MITATAPGKIILFGEHAVVYGRPAIAVPVTQVSAQVTITETGGDFVIEARDQNRTARLGELPDDDPIAAIIRKTLTALGETATAGATLIIQSTVPIAGGLGSGAAVSTAIARALAAFYKRDLDAAILSSLVYEVEKLHHGTPSGIDNTVIAFGKPVYFARAPHPPPPAPPPSPEQSNTAQERGEGWPKAGVGGEAIETFNVPTPFRLAIADTGIPSPTKIAVGDVRAAWQADPAKYESLFDRCGNIARKARALIESGQPDGLGRLMTDNHAVLREMGVSCPELDSLVEAAMRGGASGAKLSGGGRGGNMIALVTATSEGCVREALLRAGARRVILTTVKASNVKRDLSLA